MRYFKFFVLAISCAILFCSCKSNQDKLVGGGWKLNVKESYEIKNNKRHYLDEPGMHRNGSDGYEYLIYFRENGDVIMVKRDPFGSTILHSSKYHLDGDCFYIDGQSCQIVELSAKKLVYEGVGDDGDFAHSVFDNEKYSFWEYYGAIIITIICMLIWTVFCFIWEWTCSYPIKRYLFSPIYWAGGWDPTWRDFLRSKGKNSIAQRKWLLSEEGIAWQKTPKGSMFTSEVAEKYSYLPSRWAYLGWVPCICFYAIFLISILFSIASLIGIIIHFFDEQLENAWFEIVAIVFKTIYVWAGNNISWILIIAIGIVLFFVILFLCRYIVEKRCLKAVVDYEQARNRVTNTFKDMPEFLGM